VASPRKYWLLLVALLVASFGTAARLEPQFQSWRGSRANGDLFTMLLGDSRAMFAGTFFRKADAYYHSGYYPSMFDDNAAFQTAHMAEDTGAVNSKNHGDEYGFLGPERNWIDSFGRHFFPDRHTHLDEGGPGDSLNGSAEVREILPWLKLSADLDPDNVQTYTVTAYWLRQRMDNVAGADAILHEGIRNCPDSYEIFFELGRLYRESYHDRTRARNVWEHGVELWLKLDPKTPKGKCPVLDLVEEWLGRPLELVAEQKDNQLVMEQLATHLANLETEAGNYPLAIEWLQAAKRVSLAPGTIEQDIGELRAKLGQELNPLLKPLY
jgi:tetratricopeptide (TPR) repeat protein